MSTPSREIILAMKNSIVGDTYSLAFESCFNGLSTSSCNNLEEIRAAIRRNPEACVLLDLELTGTGINDLFVDRDALAKRAVLLFLGGEKSLIPEGIDPSGIHFLKTEPELKDLVAKMEEAFRISDLAAQFCKIAPHQLHARSRILPCNVFVKLSEGKYVKVMNSGDDFDKEALDRFLGKKIPYLYIPRDGYLSIMQAVLAEANALIEKPETITVQSAAAATMGVFHSMQSLFEVDGFTPQVQAMTMVSVNLARGTMKKNPKLAELLAKLDANRDSYIAWHSTALSFLSCKLATALDWKSDGTFYKLSLASMLHDLTLPNDDLAKVHDKVATGDVKPTEEELKVIVRHPIQGAQLLRGMSDEVPGEVAFIVEQHHERADGDGYPKGLSMKDISPVSALFIISHDLVDEMYRVTPGNFDMEKYLFVCESDKRFTKGAFGKEFREIMSKLKDL
jgi:HD-GYP domain-containing protein (c-di-GMP phosphodiesterase class II)